MLVMRTVSPLQNGSFSEALAFCKASRVYSLEHRMLAGISVPAAQNDPFFVRVTSSYYDSIPRRTVLSIDGSSSQLSKVTMASDDAKGARLTVTPSEHQAVIVIVVVVCMIWTILVI